MTFSRAFKGAIFDMDGVLVDSEKLYLRFWQEACAAYGYKLGYEQGLSLRSNSPETAIPKFRNWFGEKADYYAIRELRRKLMADFIDKNGVSMKPGADTILRLLREKGVKIALATASPVKRARHYLEPLGLFGYFDAVVSGADIARSKPAPDIYLAASGALGLSPAESIAVEDSPAGIVSAKTAGCFTVMIPDLTPPDESVKPYIDFLAAELADIASVI
jgi:haloacid dehalogenase superfamily, subfamily IA, variant 3 with third motif having DD or ED